MQISLGPEKHHVQPTLKWESIQDWNIAGKLSTHAPSAEDELSFYFVSLIVIYLIFLNLLITLVFIILQHTFLLRQMGGPCIAICMFANFKIEILRKN